MATENVYTLIDLDEYLVTPKYQQLINCLVKAVREGKLQKDYVLPSINDMSYELDLSRKTVERAYSRLKKIGIVASVPGKGYFINLSEVKQVIKVFLLFNKLSAHKKIIYDAFVSSLGDQAAIDFYIYNNDFRLFKKLLLNPKDKYDYYVIIPHFLEGGENAAEVINELPSGRLVLMDKLLAGINRQHAAVYENFEKGIYLALQDALPRLINYHTLKIIFPSYSYFPKEILMGFTSFCVDFAFKYRVVHDLHNEVIGAGETFINLMEDDLIILLQKIKSNSLQVGEDVGIISYNETPWKQFILNGITTISTDFQKMGEIAAQVIIEQKQLTVEVPFTLTLRNSL